MCDCAVRQRNIRASQPLTNAVYRGDLTPPGFKTATIKHLELTSSVVTHANVAMQMNPAESITVGGIGVHQFQSTISTTFSQSFIDKLP
jgi:hypothetical protein